MLSGGEEDLMLVDDWKTIKSIQMLTPCLPMAQAKVVP